VVDEGVASFVSLARPWLADPTLGVTWQKNQNERPCISCNQACLDHIFKNQRATCLVNPVACYELERSLPLYSPKLRHQKVAVVGGGVAGLSCAETLLKRGFQVDLYEKNSELGGQFKLASLIPSKERMNEVIQHYRESLQALGGRILLNQDFEGIEGDLYHHVILATGVKPRTLDSLAQSPKVFLYSEWIPKVKTEKNLLILGGGGIAFDVAHQFYEQVPEAQVTMLTRSRGKWGNTLGKTTGWILRDSLKRKGIRHLRGVEVLGMDKELGLKVRIDQKESYLKADAYVLYVGQNSDNLLAQKLSLKGISYSVIGGAREASELDAKRSILEGFECARNLVI
jgi:2,4-dienoyl-CoA reductase (NADPH2)